VFRRACRNLRSMSSRPPMNPKPRERGGLRVGASNRP
jgi:hypothetical protein